MSFFVIPKYKTTHTLLHHFFLRFAFRIRHRGPDWSGCVVKGNHIMAHERLAIVGVGKLGKWGITMGKKKLVYDVYL
jgi:asparagine synthetase B (glutamine-hydrolysing)